MNLNNLYEIFLKYPDISTDSRNIYPDSIFFALKGHNFNGNIYAAEALIKGAKYAIIDDKDYFLDNRFILVDNVLITLQQLATFHRTKFKIPLICITGTNGKTTTKEILNAILSKKFRTIATKGNLNNHIGVPLTLLSIKQDTEIAIVEIGANHVGEIAELCKIALPNFGVITNIGKAHLEGFGSIENIITTKTALYKFIRNNCGIVFVRADNNILMQHSQQMNRILYSLEKNDAVYMGKILNSNPFLNINCSYNHFNKSGYCNFDIQSKLVGTYNAENILAAVSIGDYFDVNETDIMSAINNYLPHNMRSQYIETNNNRIILDAYNANPTSMLDALLNFSQYKSTENTIILGDMLELGKDAPIEHINILNKINDLGFKDVYLVGSLFSSLNSQFKSFINVDELMKFLKIKCITNKYILIKGSRGIKLETILQVL